MFVSEELLFLSTLRTEAGIWQEAEAHISRYLGNSGSPVWEFNLTALRFPTDSSSKMNSSPWVSCGHSRQQDKNLHFFALFACPCWTKQLFMCAWPREMLKYQLLSLTSPGYRRSSAVWLCLSPEMINTFYLAILAWSAFFVLTLHQVASYRKLGKRNIMMFIKMIWKHE